MTATKITSLAQLRRHAYAGEHNYFICTADGAARSRKTIHHWSAHFYVVNHVDGSEQKLSTKQMRTRSTIAHAIDTGAFYKL